MKQEELKTIYEWKKGNFSDCQVRKGNAPGLVRKHCLVSERCQWALRHYEHEKLCMHPSIGQITGTSDAE